MKTIRLFRSFNGKVDRTATDAVPVKVAAAIAIGAALSLGLIVLALDIRPDFRDPDITFLVLAKLSLSLGAATISALLLKYVTRPGLKFWFTLPLVVLSFLAILGLAAMGMRTDPHWEPMLATGQWRVCALSVLVITAVPFSVILWAMRLVSSDILAQTGALSGLAAGAVSVIAFALHCTVDLTPLIVLWFAGTGFLCMIIGGYLGPRFLRA